MKQKINALCAELEAKKFPPFPHDEQLSSWIEDLILFDSMFAGIVFSKKDNSKVSPHEIPQISDLEESLLKIQLTHTEDVAIFYECQQYVDLLKKIREEIVNVRPHPRIRKKISENIP